MSKIELPASEGRKPAIEEAADWLRKALTLEYRLACLRAWRTLYGDEFANQVEARVGVKR